MVMVFVIRGRLCTYQAGLIGSIWEFPTPRLNTIITTHHLAVDPNSRTSLISPRHVAAVCSTVKGEIDAQIQ